MRVKALASHRDSKAVTTRLFSAIRSRFLGGIPRWAYGLLIMLCLWGLFRAALNPVLTWGINKQLSRISGLQGGVQQVRLSFWPGRLQVEGIAFDLQPDDPAADERQTPQPVLRVRRLVSTWQYGALLQGVMVGTLCVEAPKVTLWRTIAQQAAAARKQKPASDEAHVSMRWSEPFTRLMPLRVDRVDVTDASVRFVDATSRPQVDVMAAHNVQLCLRNLTNRTQLKDALYATATVSGALPGKGSLRLDMKLDPVASMPTFALTTQVQHVDLVQLNNVLQAYGNFDLSAGQFDVYSEVAAQGGQFEGYVKPLFHNLRVRVWRDKEASNGPIRLAWRAAVSAVTGLLHNREEDSMGTKLPFEGKLENPHVGIWEAVANLLGNAFIRALLPQLDYSVSMSHLPN